MSNTFEQTSESDVTKLSSKEQREVYGDDSDDDGVTVSKLFRGDGWAECERC